MILSGYALAACSGSSPTRTAASAAQADVSACITAATTGDTIQVPSGSSTWGSKLYTGGKNLTFLGATQWTSGTTTITNGGFTIGQDGGTSDQARIAGFTFISNGNYTFQIFGGTSLKTFRIDHNIITYPSAQDAIFALGATAPVEGLIDHNAFTYSRFLYYGEDGAHGSGNSRWAEPLNLGTSHYVYLEDNSFNNPDGSSGGFLNTMDGNQGCRYVVRFNTINNGRAEFHSIQGDNQRACMAWEMYNNTWTNSGANHSFRQWLVRAGTGVIFHESSDKGASNPNITLDNDRSEECSISNSTQCPGTGSRANQVPTWSMCGWNGTEQPNGNSFIDGNLTGQRGYPCRDQIGRSTDASRWSNSFTNPAPAQAFQAAYIWRNINTTDSSEVGITLNCENSGIPCTFMPTYHIVQNRDYYLYNASFTGATGIGEGVLASRPATCTTGVGYWVTDRGSWNSNLAANTSGRLDVCTSTNTWTDGYYTPYTYPHPLVGGSPAGASVKGSVAASGSVVLR